MYEDGEEDYSGLSGFEADSKKKQKKILIIVGVVILALVVIIASFIGGYLVAFYIHNDSDCTNDTDSNSPTPTPSSSPSPTPTPTQTNTNADNSDVNIQYYQTVEKHAFTVDDLVRCDKISEPIPSPDGTRVVYTRYVHNPNTNQTSTTIWIQNLSDQNKTQLTPFGWGISEFNPCWSLDGSVLLFASNRDPNNIYFPGSSTQVWQVSTNVTETGGNNLPTQLTSYPMDVNDLLCSNTLNYLAIGMNIIPGLSLQQTANKIQQAQSGSLRAYTYDKLFIRHWGNWFDGQRSHPFIQSISFSNSSFSLSSSLPIDVLNGTDADAPTKPYGGIEEWSFAPDDSEFAFTRRYDEDSSVAWTTNLDVFTVQIQNTNNNSLPPPVSITASNPAADTQPAYSPDGNYIAYLAQSVPGYESDRYALMLYNRVLQTTTSLSDNVDSSMDSVIWNHDSTGLFVTTGVNGTESIYFFDLTGNYNVIVNEHWASSVSLLNEDALIFLYNSMTTPNNVVTADIHSLNNITLIVDFNENQKNATWISEPIRFSFIGANNDTVWGWALNATENSIPGTTQTSYPVAFLIHGGPQSTWGDDWSYRWNPQTYAGHGYSVVLIDFHGSTGYGQNFTNSINNDYGGKPYYDLMTGLDYAISQFPFIDSTQQFALGASYGGWMINWINGHSTRFTSLVCHDGIFDQRIFWFDTDELWFPEHDMDGNPLTSAVVNYEQWNPSNFTNVWSTPQLVIHGGRDYRIPDTHGIGAFTALQRQNITSKFVYFPTENHWVLNPANSVYWHTTVQDWIDSFIN